MGGPEPDARMQGAGSGKGQGSFAELSQDRGHVGVLQT